MTGNDDFWNDDLGEDTPGDRSYVGVSPGEPLPPLDTDPDPTNSETDLLDEELLRSLDEPLLHEPLLDHPLGQDRLLDEPLFDEDALVSRGPSNAGRPQDAKAPVLDADIVIHRDGFTLDVRLAIGPGETVAVVGPNGCGKSTLVAAIAGFIGITFGAIKLNGVNVDAPQDKVWVPSERRKLALVPQDGLLLPHLSALANVGYGLRFRGGEPSLAKDALRDIGLAKKRRAKPSKLSGGEAQRVALARAVVLQQPLLVLDEPFSKVDAEVRPKLRSWVQSMRPPGQAQLVITHGADHAFEADLVVALENGTVTAVGQPAELAAHPPTPWLRTFFS